MTCFYIKKTVTYNDKSDCPGTVLEFTYGIRENMVAQKLIKITNPECDILRRPDFDNTKSKFYADQFSFKSEKSASYGVPGTLFLDSRIPCSNLFETNPFSSPGSHSPFVPVSFSGRLPGEPWLPPSA